MSELIMDAQKRRAMVENYPRQTKENRTIVLYVRYQREDTIFSVEVEKNCEDFDSLCQLRPGDELYVSVDGKDIANIKRNPWWKRLWMWLTWSF